MIDVPQDRCERHRLFQAIDDAFKAGELQTLSHLFQGSPRWFDEEMPTELGLGFPLEYAIYWSPISFIEALLAAGCDPNYNDGGGFPAVIAALSTDRGDKLDIVDLLLKRGADPNGRGVNDWTPLHYAVSIRDSDAVRVLLAYGGDPNLKTRIDDCDSALEAAEAAGFELAASLMRQAAASGYGAGDAV